MADKKNELHSYLLVGAENDLQNHVGHMVEIKGKAADCEDGKVKVKTKTNIDREHADDIKTESKSELKGDLIGLPCSASRTSRWSGRAVPERAGGWRLAVK